MKTLLGQLQDKVADAFERLGLDRAFGAVERSRRPDLGQFQNSGAMQAAKAARKPPRAIAEAVAADLRADPAFADVSIAGPGFLNLSLTDDALAAWAATVATDPRAGCPKAAAPQTVVLDFGGPNVAKAMHVGHLRSSIIGDTLQRLFRFAGHTVHSDIHLGDWGLQMGMLLEEMKRARPDLVYFDADFHGPYPDVSPVTIDDLQEMYPRAAARCKEDEGARREARLATAELQGGRAGYVALWRHFVAATRASLEVDFDRLDVHFDYWYGESTVNDRLPEVVATLERGGFLEESEGARVVHVARDGDKHEVPPLIIEKGDGGYTYGATDLATIQMRVADFAPDLILYVVDQRQHLHFEQVFRAAQRSGIAGAARLQHVGFGTVNGPDGKPFKTRAGGVLKLGDLIEMATAEARARIDEAGLAKDADDAEKAGTADRVGVAAVRYADLMNERTSDYVFEFAKFTRFEGNTGPYLLYATVRVKSLLRKAAELGATPGAVLPPRTEVERALLLQLAGFGDVVADAIDKRLPHFLCEHAFTLAREFSRFWQGESILKESDEALRASRLGLSRMVHDQLEVILGLLGIRTVERM